LGRPTGEKVDPHPSGAKSTGHPNFKPELSSLIGIKHGLNDRKMLISPNSISIWQGVKVKKRKLNLYL
jgi:hypothetical protein